MNTTSPLPDNWWVRIGWLLSVGYALNAALNLFHWDRVSVILLSIFAVVILAELLVTAIRKRIM